MQKGQTGVLILVGILVLVGIAGGAYFLGRETSKSVEIVSQPQITPQLTLLPTSLPQASASTETANWKTYTDKIHDFSFKYPNNWVQSQSTTVVLFQEPKIGPLKMIVSVELYENAGNLSAEQFLNQIFYKDSEYTGNLKRLKDFYMKNVSYKKVSVDGVSAEQFQPNQPTGSAGVMVWITKGKLGILLHSNPVEGGEEIINQILSTFKFTP